MKVCVEMACYVDIDDPTLEELDTLHKNKGYGTHEQYEEAAAAVEKATNFKFFDITRDGIEHSEPRIVGVYNTTDFEAILEA